MFSFFKKKDVFTAAENERIITAIRNAEKATSGEVRIYVESKNPLVDPLERAALVFFNLKMDQTVQRNAVLLYIAMKDKEVALFGDTGIHQQVGDAYWQEAVQDMLQHFKKDLLTDGIVYCLDRIGKTLSEKFPYLSAEDKNELPDEIVFGK